MGLFFAKYYIESEEKPIETDTTYTPETVELVHSLPNSLYGRLVDRLVYGYR